MDLSVKLKYCQKRTRPNSGNVARGRDDLQVTGALLPLQVSPDA